MKCCPVRKHNFVEKVHKKMPKCKINFSFLTIKSSRVILGLFQLCPQMHIPQQKNLRPQFVEQYLRKRYNETPQVPKMIQHGRILYLLISLILYLFSLYVRVCLVFVIRISYFCTKSTSYDYRTIWHLGQFDTSDNLTPSCIIGQFDTNKWRGTVWHHGQFYTKKVVDSSRLIFYF